MSYLADLYGQAIEHMSMSDVQELYFLLGLDHEDSAYGGRADLLRDLMFYVARNERLGEFVEVLRREKPQIDWLGVPDNFVYEQDDFYDEGRAGQNYVFAETYVGGDVNIGRQQIVEEGGVGGDWYEVKGNYVAGDVVERGWPRVVVLAIVVIACVAVLVGGSFVEGPIQIVTDTASRWLGRAEEDEILIVIFTFHRSDGVVDTEIQEEIRRNIEAKAHALNFDALRVVVDPTILTDDGRDRAEELGEQYKAEIVIWGADTGVKVSVNFLNLQEPDFEAAFVEIDETERSVVANPPAYAQFVTQDLPGQMTFLSFFAVGQSYYVGEDYEEAERIIREAVNSLTLTMPEAVVGAYFRLGWLNQVLEDHQQALEDYDQAIVLNPEYAIAYANRGISKRILGDLDGEMADYDQAITINPKLATVYYNRGIAKSDLGDLEEAIADFDQAIALNPEDVAAYSNRGVVKSYLGDFEGAIADYDQAIALNPEFAIVYYNRGNAKTYLGDLEEAIADYDQTIALNPEYVDAYCNRGVVKSELGDFEGAIADCDQAIALNPEDAAAYYNRGNVKTYLGDLEEAIADYDRAIVLNPELAIAYSNRGNTKRSLGDLEGAIMDYDQAIALNPEDTTIYYNRGIAKSELGDFEGEIADYDQIIVLDPEYADAYYNRGIAKSELGDFEGAIADYDQVIALDPEYVNAYWGRGMARKDLGDLTGAIADLEMYLELVPDSPIRDDLEVLINQMKQELEGSGGV
ncbi:MAG TPA: tetratricopeptide repeat protein [Anaerolineae bacterium]|nr:tetratricopeptide repeat protein [Anaerolineae bacterium]